MFGTSIYQQNIDGTSTETKCEVVQQQLVFFHHNNTPANFAFFRISGQQSNNVMNSVLHLPHFPDLQT
jgi:hypothetical protein